MLLAQTRNLGIRIVDDFSKARFGLYAVAIAREGFAPCIEDELVSGRYAYDRRHDASGAIVDTGDSQGDFVPIVIDIRSWSDFVQNRIPMGFFGRRSGSAGDDRNVDPKGSQAIDNTGDRIVVLTPGLGIKPRNSNPDCLETQAHSSTAWELDSTPVR